MNRNNGWISGSMFNSLGFIAFILAIILFVFAPIKRIQCNNLGDVYNTETKFYYTNGCFIKDGDKWFQADLWLKYNLAKEKGVNISIMDVNNNQKM